MSCSLFLTVRNFSKEHVSLACRTHSNLYQPRISNSTTVREQTPPPPPPKKTSTPPLPRTYRLRLRLPLKPPQPPLPKTPNLLPPLPPYTPPPATPTPTPTPKPSSPFPPPPFPNRIPPTTYLVSGDRSDLIPTRPAAARSGSDRIAPHRIGKKERKRAPKIPIPLGDGAGIGWDGMGCFD